MNSEDATAVAMLKMGYATDDSTDQNRCLNFRVGFTDPFAAAAACVVIGEYNDFQGQSVATAICKIAALDKHAHIEVGREGSPVVYVNSWSLPSQRVMKILDEARPDECDNDGTNVVRAWWD